MLHSPLHLHTSPAFAKQQSKCAAALLHLLLQRHSSVLHSSCGCHNMPAAAPVIAAANQASPKPSPQASLIATHLLVNVSHTSTMLSSSQLRCAALLP